MIQAISFRSPFNTRFRSQLSRKDEDLNVYNRGSERSEKMSRIFYFQGMLAKLARKSAEEHSRTNSKALARDSLRKSIARKFN